MSPRNVIVRVGKLALLIIDPISVYKGSVVSQPRRSFSLGYGAARSWLR
jgi:hypothetical protein